MSELLTVSVLWAFAVVLYYHGGKRLGYSKGFQDGLLKGSDDVFRLLSKSNDESSK